jgi:hypothetical protein
MSVSPKGRFSRVRIRLQALIVGAAIVSTVAGVGGTAVSAPSAQSQTSVVITWIEVMLDAIKLNPPAPTATTWKMHVVASSIYDAWAAYDPEALATRTGGDLRRPPEERTEANKAEAISYAAYRSLSTVYPNQKSMFGATLTGLGYSMGGTKSFDVTKPAGLGNTCARAVVDHRMKDGSNALAFTEVTSPTYPSLYQAVNGPDPEASNAPGGADFDPNRWQPLRVPTGTLKDQNGIPIFDNDDPTTYRDQGYLTPQWGAVKPFAMTSASQFRPPAPPQYGSTAPYVDSLGKVTTNDQAWHDQTAAVLALSAGLTDAQKVVTEFWADGPQSWTPPGHWVQIAMGLASRDQHSLDDDVKMYFALTGGLLDAGIAAWEAKRHYDFIRPISAIRHKYYGQQIMAWGGPNQGTQLINGQDWRPYQLPTFLTPPFPEFVSGHSTFSRTAREVLLAFTGTDALYDGVTKIGHDFDGDGRQDLLGQHVQRPASLRIDTASPAKKTVLRWSTMLDAANEAGISRRYGGIHFLDGDYRARAMGAQIGPQAYTWAALHWLPFGTLRDEVNERAGQAQVTPTAQADLVAEIDQAEAAFDGGDTAGACANLVELREELAEQRGTGVTEEAFQALDRMAGEVHALVCLR